jgi:hypothetical protein
VAGDAADQVRRVLGNRLLTEGLALGEQLKRGQPALLGLEEDVERALTSLAASGH